MSKSVSVNQLSKEYILGSEVLSSKNFRELVVGAFSTPFRKFRRLQGNDVTQERFWALKDISFEVDSGEVIGVIGRNGAGKSTLLKLLSRITSPTEGRIEYRGKVASLLEVGTGFHPELTGRENIYLNGSILGMSKSEIDLRLDDIVKFAEVERFLDTPVKRYSSGMYVRLAFSVAAHLEPDILIVDEVLAVGDQAFQQKCLGKLQDTARSGRTVFFVSHNMTSIRNLCDRILYLKDGQLEFDGDTSTAISKYLSTNKFSGASWSDRESTNLHLKSVELIDHTGQVSNGFNYDHGLDVRLTVERMREDRTAAAVRITDMAGHIIFTSWERDFIQDIQYRTGARCTLICNVPAKLLAPGEYVVTAMVRAIDDHGRINFEEINFDISIAGDTCPIPSGRLGLIAPLLSWDQEKG